MLYPLLSSLLLLVYTCLLLWFTQRKTSYTHSESEPSLSNDSESVTMSDTPAVTVSCDLADLKTCDLAVTQQRSSSEPIRQRSSYERTNVKKHSVSAPHQRYIVSQTLVPKHIATSAPLQSPDTSIRYSRSFPRTRFVKRSSHNYSLPDHGYSFYDPKDPPKDESLIFDIYVDEARPHSADIHSNSVYVMDDGVETPILIIVSTNTQDVGEIFDDPIIVKAYNDESWELTQRKIRKYNAFIESIVEGKIPEAHTDFEQAIIDLDSYYHGSSKANKRLIESGTHPHIKLINGRFNIKAPLVPLDLGIGYLHNNSDINKFVNTKYRPGFLVAYRTDAYGLNLLDYKSINYEFPIRYDLFGNRALVERDEYGYWY